MARDIPIIFSAPMVQALLAGRKTQTRRILKPQPPKEQDFPGSVFGLSRAVADGVNVFSLNDHDRLPKHPTKWDLVGSVGVARAAGYPMEYNARYAVGDRLWVRENWRRSAWRPAEYAAMGGRGMAVTVEYKADGAKETFLDPGFDIERAHGSTIPSIHMPRWASRLTLIVEGVKVERLQDISEADALAEGVAGKYLCSIGGELYGVPGTMAQGFDSPQPAFRGLWSSINGEGAWDANPWVVALTFSVHRANIDAMEAA